jgi:hypothetical protein
MPVGSDGFHTLPAELWRNIFNYVDEIDLWFTCRQVSRLLRSEAEREMAAHRLQKLNFRSHFHTKIELHGEITHVLGIIMNPKLENFSKDKPRVLYKFQVAFAPDLVTAQAEEELLGMIKYRLDEFKISDLDFVERDSRGMSGRQIHIDNFMNKIEIPGLEIDAAAKRLSFEWRPFLDHFFAEEAYVRHMRSRSALTKDERLENAERMLRAKGQDFTSQNFGHLLAKNGLEDRAIWERAYGLRLKRAFENAGSTLDVEMYRDLIRRRCATMDAARWGIRIERFMESRGYTD